MFGIFGGPWKLAGSPLGRLACVLLACCIPGGGAVPGADMPGGGPVKVSRDDFGGKLYSYPFPVEAPCQAAYQSGLGSLQILVGARMAILDLILALLKLLELHGKAHLTSIRIV